MSNLLRNKNEAIQILQIELGKKRIDPSAVADRALVAFKAEAAYVASMKDIKDANINIESMASIHKIWHDWHAFATLTKEEVAKEIHDLADGHDKRDKADILKVASLIEQGKVKEAKEFHSHLDTFVRDCFPDNILHWLWFHGGRNTKGCDYYPAGFRMGTGI